VLLAQLTVGIVDCLKEVLEAGSLVDRPKARKTVAEQFHLALGE
jgi:hypothetical protein